MNRRRFKKAFFIALSLHFLIFLIGCMVVKNYNINDPEKEYIEVSLLSDSLASGSSENNGGSSSKNDYSRPNKTSVSRQKHREYKQTIQTAQYYDTNAEVSSDDGDDVSTGSIGNVSGNGDGTGSGGMGTGSGNGLGKGNGNGDGNGDGSESDVVKIRPSIISSCKPRYPQSARRNGIEGTVVVTILILKNGTVGEAYVSSSSGNSELDDAAINAICKWRFSPASNSLGQSMECYTTIPIGFSLN